MLKNKAPTTLVDGLESFVSILRNRRQASNIDVEMYFKDFSKLILKMQRLDATTLDLDIVQRHREHLALLSHGFSDPTHADFRTNAPYAVFIAWAQNFCEYAIRVLLASEEQTYIDQLVMKRNALEAEAALISKIEAIYKEYDMVGFYQTEKADAEARLTDFYTPMID